MTDHDLINNLDTIDFNNFIFDVNQFSNETYERVKHRLKYVIKDGEFVNFFGLLNSLNDTGKATVNSDGELHSFNDKPSRIVYRYTVGYRNKEYIETTKYYHQNNKLHRVNGPAIIITTKEHYGSQENFTVDHDIYGSYSMEQNESEYWVEGVKCKDISHHAEMVNTMYQKKNLEATQILIKEIQELNSNIQQLKNPTS